MPGLFLPFLQKPDLIPHQRRRYPPCLEALLPLPTPKLGPFETWQTGQLAPEGESSVGWHRRGRRPWALRLSAAGGGTEAKLGAAEPAPRTGVLVQGSASARCFLPALFADGRREATSSFSSAEANQPLAWVQPRSPVSGETRPAAPSPGPGKRGRHEPRGSPSPAVLRSPG